MSSTLSSAHLRTTLAFALQTRLTGMSLPVSASRCSLTTALKLSAPRARLETHKSLADAHQPPGSTRPTTLPSLIVRSLRSSLRLPCKMAWRELGTSCTARNGQSAPLPPPVLTWTKSAVPTTSGVRFTAVASSTTKLSSAPTTVNIHGK